MSLATSRPVLSAMHRRYSFQRRAEKASAASLKTFCIAWKTDVPWLVIAKSICKFSKCGTCEYLKWLIDRTPRSEKALMQMFITRLGEHFNFQSAQRLCVNRIEEKCRQSGGLKWLMLIDKMDQNCCHLPTIWEMIRTPFFKDGERMQMSVIGAWFFGTSRSPEIMIRTVWEDIGPHGANMQMSTMLMNFHNRAMLEGELPEEWFINADNTPKETKNNQCICFMIWLLINLDTTRLCSITLLFMIVGHTHNKLDRFFGRLKQTLQGHTYFTREQVMTRLRDALHGFTFDAPHLTDVWDWWNMETALNTPRPTHLYRVHAINVFRHRGAIMMKWKQYLTSESWSKPVLLIPPHLFDQYKTYRPPRVPKAFKKTFVGLFESWLLHLQTMLNDRKGSNHAEDIEALKNCVQKTDGRYDNQVDLDQIVADLIRVGGDSRRDDDPSPRMPDDTLVQSFPGGDHVEMPADALVEITDIWTPTRTADIGLMSMVIANMPMVINGIPIPFSMGTVVAPVNTDGDTQLILQWWVPGAAAR